MNHEDTKVTKSTKHIDLQLDYWNGVGPSKTFAHPVNIERLNDLLPTDAAILDFGCGYGRVSGILYECGYRNLLGVDPAAAMIARARQRFPNIRFETLDGARLPVGDDSLDAVLLFSVLTCVPTDHGQRAVIGEMTRVIKPGGVLYISDLWLQTDAGNLERYQTGLAAHGIYGVFDLPEGVTVRHHDRASIESLTESYEMLAIDDLEVTTMNGHQADGFQWFGRKQISEAARTISTKAP